jgi:CRP-like cAMP-binding protein
MPPSARSLLDRLPQGRALSKRDRQRALRWMSSVRLAPGEVLYSQGEAPQQLGLLLDGSLLVSTQAPDAAELVLARVSPGEVIGEMGLLDDAPRSATVRCERSATLLVLDRARFEELDQHADTVLLWLLDIAARGMAERITAMNTRIAEAAVDPDALARSGAATSAPGRGPKSWLLALWRRP